MRLKKLKSSLENSLWQVLPMISTLLLSLLVVKLFSIDLWGNIVSVLVIQQIINGVLNWGNKDFLQRELASNYTLFNSITCQLFIERFLLFTTSCILVYLFDIIEKTYLVSFYLIVFFKFFNQSFDIFITKERKFFSIFIFDLFVLLIQINLIILIKYSFEVSINKLLIIFWLPLIFKSIFLIFKFRKEFEISNFKKLYIVESFFFGMLAISGLIHSKIDIFFVSNLLDPKTLGEYQIIMAFLWSVQSLSMFISGPFIHNFYRLNNTSRINSSKLLNKLGLLIVPFCVLIAMTILALVFNISISISILIASLLFSITSFIYLPWVFQIFKNKQEYIILLVNIVGSLVLVSILLSVNYVSKLTLEILIWIITIHQVLITISFYLTNKYLKNEN